MVMGMSDQDAMAAAEAARQQTIATQGTDEDNGSSSPVSTSEDVLGLGTWLHDGGGKHKIVKDRPSSKNEVWSMDSKGSKKPVPEIDPYKPESDTAEDGQKLAQQTLWTQTTFRTQYGQRADIEWAKQHNAELKRNRQIYGVSDPTAGTKPLATAPGTTPLAPNRTIGAATPPTSGPATPGTAAANPYAPSSFQITPYQFPAAAAAAMVSNAPARYGPTDSLTILDTTNNQVKTMTGAQYDEQKKNYPSISQTTKVVTVTPVGGAPTSLPDTSSAPATSSPVEVNYDIITIKNKINGQVLQIPRSRVSEFTADPTGLGSPWEVQETSPTANSGVSQKMSLNETTSVPYDQRELEEKPVDTLAQISVRSRGGSVQDVSNESTRILQGIGALLRGDRNATWAEPYLNDIARVAWVKEQRAQGKTASPSQAPTDYIESWKDAFYGSDHTVPLVKDLDQQMLDHAVDMTPAGQPFNWKVAYGDTGERGLISTQTASNDCGPNAFSTILRSRGYNADPGTSFQYAKETGFHNGDAFTGPQRYAQMLREKAGLDAQAQAIDPTIIDKELDAGNPVTLSSGGHYWVTTAYRDTPRGREYYTGSTGAIVGNPEWATLDKIHYGGAPNIMITAHGDVDPNSEAVRAMGLRPAEGSNPGRANLSRMTTGNSTASSIQTTQQDSGTLSLQDSVAAPYQPLIQKAAARYQTDPYLVAAVLEQESEGKTDALSGKGAGGLMQIMPDTARGLGVTDVNDPEQSISGGTKYLSQLLEMYDGNVDLALAAYNAGPGAVNAYRGIPPYEETQQYVRDVKARLQRLRQGTVTQQERGY